MIPRSCWGRHVGRVAGRSFGDALRASCIRSILMVHCIHARASVPAGSLREADVRRIQAAFDERRAAAHVPAMFLATPHDQHSAHWCVVGVVVVGYTV